MIGRQEYVTGGNLMALAELKGHTIEDIYALPDGQRAELIDGEMYMMAPPSRRHQHISMSLSHTIKDYIISQNGTCDVYAAPFAVFLSKDDKTYVEPDISVICDKDKLTEEGCSGAPDWIIEIVSPGSRQMDYMKKLFKYRSANVREYWIVDIEKKRITVYDFQNTVTEEYNLNEIVPVSIFKDLSIDFKEIMNR